MNKALRVSILTALVAVAVALSVAVLAGMVLHKTSPAIGVSSQTIQSYMGNPSLNDMRYLEQKGLLYYAYVYSASVPSGGDLDLIIVTDPTTATAAVKTYATLQWTNSSGTVITGSGVISGYENAVMSTTVPVTVSIVNQNFSAASTPKTAIYTNQTLVSVGTLKTASIVPADAAAMTEREWALAPGRTYLFRFANLADTAHSVLGSVTFYEGNY